MVTQTARRRIHTISGHFSTGLLAEDVTAPATNLFPLNCSSSLSTPFQRLDNRLHYGRQASASQGYFMKQAVKPSEQDCSSNSDTSFRRLDNRLHYGRQGSASQGYFMRQAVTPLEQDNSVQSDVESDVPCMSNINEEKSVASPTPALFARPKAEFHCSDVGVIESNTQANMLRASECPEFSRPVEQTSEMMKFSSKGPTVSSRIINGIEMSRRINVVESKCNYVITVELPGVDIRDIRFEMDDQNLIVRGTRSMKWRKDGDCSNDSQGHYQVVWPLPACANKDSISAEFMEGLLQITIPKM